jgi:uncharacterized pyridoxal phosphate-containing UPF0001 family protein
MDPKQMIREVIEINQATFDNTFETLAKMQAQMEKLTGSLIEQSTGFSGEYKKAIDDWSSTFKKAGTGFKKSLDDQFEKLLETFKEKKAK